MKKKLIPSPFEYRCPECGKKFNVAGALANHVKWRHKNLKVKKAGEEAKNERGQDN